jgi:hypothetical protein
MPRSVLSTVGYAITTTAPTDLAGQVEQPYGPMGPPTLFAIPVLRHMKIFRRPRESGGPEAAPGSNRGASDKNLGS